MSLKLFSFLKRKSETSPISDPNTVPAVRAGVATLPDRAPRASTATLDKAPRHTNAGPSQPPHAGDHHHSPVPHDGPSTTRRRRRSRVRGQGDQATQAAPAALKLPPAIAPISETFRTLGVDATALDAIAALGYESPSPIQEQAIPLLLEGRDVVGLAQTGTGKTIAFGLPLARSIDPSRNEVQAVVLVPTRELANQVRDVLDHLGRFYGFTTITLVGGRSLKSDFAALEKGAQVVVGTPGRIIDHLERRTLAIGTAHNVVLDEADQMLDIGFLPAINRIMRNVPKDRQTSLFSATMPESIRRLVWRFMRDAVEVKVSAEQKPAEGVRQLYCEVAERDKFFALRFLYEDQGLGRSLIFRRTKIGVDRLTDQLKAAGVPARAIHGDLRQGERDRVMAAFRDGSLDFLVATNVAARGLDIPDIEHVINYDVPQNAEEYIHRVGRTARAGKTGSAITFVSEWEFKDWDMIVRQVGDAALEPVKLPARWE